MVDFAKRRSRLGDVGYNHSGVDSCSGMTTFSCLSRSSLKDFSDPLDSMFAFSEQSVVLLDIRDDWCSELRRRFMALGVEVFHGPDATEIGSAPLVLVDRKGHARSKSSGYIDYALTIHPGAFLCIVMGGRGISDACLTVPAPQNDDIRSLLSAAGMNFISVLEK